MEMKGDSHKHKTVEPDESESLADIFAFLALLVRYPDISFFDNEFLDTLEILLTRLNLEKSCLKISIWRNSVEDPLLDAQLEYTRLFINAVPHVIAPPYASVYQDGDFSLQGKTTEKIRNFYRQHGFDVVVSTQPADHIQFELEFLSYIYRQGQFDVGDYFLSTFFVPWFEKFLQKISEELRHPLYRVSLQLITYFVKEEQ
ncbi:MAG TPA: hypothetical protein ENK96_03585 [Desulfobulbaceae bacterium]|nr:hypothetical protein [Desulfobulbaceae bacterium]